MINEINTMLRKKISLTKIAKKLNFYEGTSITRAAIGQGYILTVPQFVPVAKK